MEGYYLGIDAGTSGLKAVAIDRQGRVVGQGTASYALQTPRPGWAEGEPEQWWDALCAATRQALAAAGVDGAAVAAVGFAGQMHTLVLLDGQHRPVRPAISWADTRGAAERAEIEARVGRDRLIAITGSPAVSAFTATRLLWVRRHEPDVWARARLALLPKDYLRLRLTGTVGTDPTDAGATGLLDLRRRDWSPDVLAALDLPRDLLPPISPSATCAGTVSAAAAVETGLRAGTPVATGAGDQECAALGCGITAPGPLLITVGTGGQAFAATAEPVVDGQGRLHSLPHLLPGRWHVMAAIPAAGLAVTWLRRLLVPSPATTPQPSGTPSPPATSQPFAPPAAQPSVPAATSQPFGTPMPPVRQPSDGPAPATAPWPVGAPPIFLPAVAGERTPSMDESASGLLFGLNLAHRAGDLLFAAHEGVAFALRACLDVLDELGIAMEPIAVTGGLSADGDFVALLANVLGRPLAPAAQREGSGYGAALLAALCVGALPVPGAPLLAGTTVQPDPAWSAWHARRYAIYKQLSPALRG